MTATALLADLFPGTVPTFAAGVEKPLARAVDRPFGNFFFREQAHAYEALPTSTKAPHVRWVYYGKPVDGRPQGRTHASRIFTFGRETRGAAHRDVWKHLKGINHANYGTSGFMQTGCIREVIERKYLFQRQADAAMGLLYVIAAEGAQILDVDALSEHMGCKEPENGDGEIIFSGCLPPARVLGAALCAMGLEGSRPTVVEVLANPNYLG